MATDGERQTLDVPVTHEEIAIERRAVDRRPAEGSIGEQVEVGKRCLQETRQVSGTMKKEVVDVDLKRDVQPADEWRNPR